MSAAAVRAQHVVVAAQQAQLPQRPRGDRPAGCAPTRRHSLLSLSGLPLALAAAQLPAHAAENAGGVDAASSPLIQELLRRTEENKEARAKERLEDYYRRNFGDYLSFQAGSAGGSNLTENQKRIQEWLQQNVEPPISIPARQQ